MPDRPTTALPPPPPLPQRWTDTLPLVIGGIALWFVAFVVLLVARFGFGAHTSDPMWLCLAGWVLGLIGLAIMLWQRSASRRGSRGAQRI